MKNNIIIAGIPKTGKSIISHRLAKQYGYQLLSEDYMKYIHRANCENFYFITSDVTPEERFTIQKK